MRAHVFLHARARACYTCEHVLPTRARTCFLHVRARYLFVRARLLFKNVRPGQLKSENVNYGNHIHKRLEILESIYCWDTKGVTAGRQSRADGH